MYRELDLNDHMILKQKYEFRISELESELHYQTNLFDSQRQLFEKDF